MRPLSVYQHANGNVVALVEYDAGGLSTATLAEAFALAADALARVELGDLAIRWPTIAVCPEGVAVKVAADSPEETRAWRAALSAACRAARLPNPPEDS